MKNEEIENLEGEVWVDVKGYEGYYQISNMGRVKSFSRTVRCGEYFRTIKDRILKPSRRPDGYYVIGLGVDGITKWFNLHRMVAEHFIENDDPVNKNDVDHIDNTRKDDNSVKNLRWSTRKENNNNRKRKYTYEVQKIVCVNTGEEFESLVEAGKKYGLKYYNVSSCCKGCSKTSGIHPETGEKLVWRYYDDYIKLKEENKLNDILIKNKRIYCITTNKIFDSLDEAGEYAKLKNPYSIVQCCQGSKQSAGKTESGQPLIWKYIIYDLKKAN